MAELTFADVIDFLSDQEGQRVYVEIGAPDAENPQQPADAFILKLHGYRLGRVEDAEDETGGRKAPMIRLEPADPNPDEEDERAGSRLFINPRQVTKIEGNPRSGLKVWLDDAVYVCILGS